MEKLIHKKMIEIVKAVSTAGVQKNGVNTEQGWRYRSVDDVINSMSRFFGDHGVFITSKIHSCDREERSTNKGVRFFTKLVIEYFFHAEDGSYVSTQIASEGLGNDDKSINKALSAAYKYALIQAFCIPFTDVMIDGDQDTAEVHPKKVNDTPTLANELRKRAKAVYDVIIDNLSNQVTVEFLKDAWLMDWHKKVMHKDFPVDIRNNILGTLQARGLHVDELLGNKSE